MSKVKAISLDDTGELPNPLGSTSRPGSGVDQDLVFSPAYAGQSPHAAVDDDELPRDGTMRRGGKYQLSDGLTRFSAVLGIGKSARGSIKANPLLIVFVSLALVFGALYLYLGDELITKLMSALSLTDETMISDKSATPAPTTTTRRPKVAAKAEADPESAKNKTEGQPYEEIPGNPYWKLPNPGPIASENLTQMTAQQNESWRAGLNHPFPYQRLKSTQDMRSKRVGGSSVILYEALAQPKFWTRMEALHGIAEQGIAIDTESMKAAIGDARSDLVKNYFKRFRTNYNETTAHIMRQALRVVDGHARFVILSNLLIRRNEVNEQYLYAASLHENDGAAKALVSEALAIRPVSVPNQALYRKAMAAHIVAPPSVKKGVQTIKVEKIPANMNVEEVYFINDQDAEPEHTSESTTDAKKVDDGFNQLQHTDEAPTEKPQEGTSKERH
jgi:hypothetical protein